MKNTAEKRQAESSDPGAGSDFFRRFAQVGGTFCIVFFGALVLTAEADIIRDVIPAKWQLLVLAGNLICNLFLLSCLVVLTWKFPK